MDIRNVNNDNTHNIGMYSHLLNELENVVAIAIGISFGIWIFTFIITLFIYWLLIKLNTSKEGINRLILCLISIAVGAILGDAVLNLIPEIFSIHTSSSGEVMNKGNPIISSTIIIGAYLGYFILEKIVRLVTNNKHHYTFASVDKDKNEKHLDRHEPIIKNNQENIDPDKIFESILKN